MTGARGELAHGRALAAGIAVVVAGVLPGFFTASLAHRMVEDFALDDSTLGAALACFYLSACGARAAGTPCAGGPFSLMGHRACLLALVVALATALGACGGDDEQVGGGGGGEQQASSIRVLETAGIPSAFLEYAVDRGHFEQEGLDVTVQPSQGGAEAIPALVSGDIQIAGSNAVSVMLAASQGLDLRIVAPGTFARPDEDFSAIMAGKDGPIRRPEDLEGRSLAVNTLKNITEVTAREALAKEGVDPSSLRLTELPFPEMAQAVGKGDVDAAFVIEPFVTAAKGEGLRVVASPYNGTRPGLQIGSYVVQAGFAESNADVVEGFANGVAATAEAIEEDPDEFRRFLPEASELPEAAARSVTLPQWRGESDREALELLADLMVKYELAEEKPDVDELLEGVDR